MDYYATPAFLNDVDKLSSNPSYRSCRSDICRSFKNISSISDAIKMPKILRDGHDWAIIKKRIPSSERNSGTSAGYRIIIYAKLPDDAIYLIRMYPKTGKYGRGNVTKEELKEWSAMLKSEKESKRLIKISIDEGLAVIATQEVAVAERQTK